MKLRKKTTRRYSADAAIFEKEGSLTAMLAERNTVMKGRPSRQLQATARRAHRGWTPVDALACELLHEVKYSVDCQSGAYRLG